MKKNIIEIDTNRISRDNYKQKFDDVMEFLEGIRKDCDYHLNFELYNFITDPKFRTCDELAKLLNLKALVNNQIADVVAKAYRTGMLDDWDDTHYQECYASKNSDAEYWADYEAEGYDCSCQNPYKEKSH